MFCSIAIMAMGMCMVACGTDKSVAKDKDATTEVVTETDSSENAENVQDDETGDSGNVTNDTTAALFYAQPPQTRMNTGFAQNLKTIKHIYNHT